MVRLVWSTNAYHCADLGLTRGHCAFTNLYHRDGGLGHDLSVEGSVVAWASVARVM